MIRLDSQGQPGELGYTWYNQTISSQLGLGNITWRSGLGHILHQHIPGHLLCTGGGSSNDLGVDGVRAGVEEFVATDISVGDLHPGQAGEEGEESWEPHLLSLYSLSHCPAWPGNDW